MAKPITDQRSIGSPARPRHIPRRSERTALCEAPHTSAPQEVSLSVQAVKKRVNVSSLVDTGGQARSPASSEFDTCSLRKRRNAEGTPLMESTSNFQQRDRRAVMSSHSPSDHVTLSTRSHQCSERSRVLVPWREPSLEYCPGYDYNSLDTPSPALQPDSY